MSSARSALPCPLIGQCMQFVLVLLCYHHGVAQCVSFSFVFLVLALQGVYRSFYCSAPGLQVSGVQLRVLLDVMHTIIHRFDAFTRNML